MFQPYQLYLLRQSWKSGHYVCYLVEANCYTLAFQSILLLYGLIVDCNIGGNFDTSNQRSRVTKAGADFLIELP